GRFEPPEALYAGSTGLEFYERLAQDAPEALQPDGWLVVELGDAEGARRVFESRGWGVEIRPDLAGLPRVLLARRLA
ncbi:MAG: hypothetical protein WHU10_02235, partial [Fimbriimonadales bacterium]